MKWMFKEDHSLGKVFHYFYLSMGNRYYENYAFVFRSLYIVLVLIVVLGRQGLATRSS